MKWSFLAAFQRAPEKPRIEPTLSFHGEVRAGSGPCRLVKALPAERRAVVQERCQRCGSRPGSAREAKGVAHCVLQGLDLDGPTPDRDERGRLMPSLSFRTT